MTLSPVMQVALEKLDEHEILVRWPGGFWTYPHCPESGSFVDHDHERRGIPNWWIGAQTVDALIARNLVQVSAYNERGYACTVTRKTAPS
jgi:hypothetical protein